ncbi:MAG: protein translocase subunit SecF [bacterium]
MIPIISHRRIFYSISGILLCASILALILWGLKLGIDFTGGSLLQVEFKGERPANSAIEQKLAEIDLGNISIQPVGDKGAILKFRDINEETHQKIITDLGGSSVVEEKSFESVGPVIGQELQRRAVYAIVFVLLMIVIYIAYAFRKVSKPVASWRYGVAAIIALLHDVVIPTGFFAVLGHFMDVEVGLLFVTALLTILGFSVHDTIVVFDRIRENLRKGVGSDFENTVEVSVNQTLGRSINTSLVVLLTMLAVFLFGGESTRYFSLVLIIGLFFGTYSSIFIASTLLVSWERFRRKRLVSVR